MHVSSHWYTTQVSRCQLNFKTVQWLSRVLFEQFAAGESSSQASMVRAVRATVRPEVLQGRIGWNLDDAGIGVGRRISETYQDPTLAFPGMQGITDRPTLVKGDDNLWYVLELCEPLRSLIDMSADFFGYDGPREVLTFITEGEKPPALLGFTLADDDADNVPTMRQLLKYVVSTRLSFGLPTAYSHGNSLENTTGRLRLLPH